jgi:hypothetical protein
MFPGEQPLSVPCNQKSSKIPSEASDMNAQTLLSTFNCNVVLLLIILSMHCFFPLVGIAAKESPIAQHKLFAVVQFV